jgi:5-methylphenazine-1-carboxylate 1-monooxygenase
VQRATKSSHTIITYADYHGSARPLTVHGIVPGARLREDILKVAIVGGGIGGMALALSLHAAGIHDLDIYESAPAIRELGVGINVLPHAVRELAELGLLDELAAVGIPTAEFAYYSKLGQRIWSEALGMATGYRWPQFSIHRGELLGILHQAVVERLGPQRIHPGHHLVSFGQGQDGRVWGDFVNATRDTPVGRIESDLLVGCDGIHSMVRRTLYPSEGPPRWNGVTMWRGVTVGMPFLTGRTMINAGSSKQRVVVYPISKTHEDRGEALINWVATRRTADDGPIPTQDWTAIARREEVLASFASFAFDFLDVPTLIREAGAVYQYPMVDRDPLPTWVFGRVTVLGDAAHPMHPVGGNGASQAIIDARVLARELALQTSIEDAITAYDAQRRLETAAVVQSNRQAGPHRCQDLVEERAPGGFTNLNDVVSQQELGEIADDYKRIAGFAVESLNNRPSLSIR